MNTLGRLLSRIRAWRLHRWAEDLQRDAEHHRRAAMRHSYEANLFRTRASEVRALARRIQAARS